MNHASLNGLARRLARLQEEATRAQLIASPPIIHTSWGGQEDQDEPQEGVIRIVTSWGNPKLEREAREAL